MISLINDITSIVSSLAIASVRRCFIISHGSKASHGEPHDTQDRRIFMCATGCNQSNATGLLKKNSTFKV